MALQRAGLPARWAFHLKAMEGPQLHPPTTPVTGLCLFMHSVPLVQAGPGACHFRVLISSPGPLSPSGKVCEGQSSSQQVCAQTPIIPVLLGGWAKEEQEGDSMPCPLPGRALFLDMLQEVVCCLPGRAGCRHELGSVLRRGLNRRPLRGSASPIQVATFDPHQKVFLCWVVGAPLYIINSSQWEGVKAPEKLYNTLPRLAQSTMCPPGRQD